MAALRRARGGLDPAATYYYGNSLGAILGAVVAGVAPDLERVVLGVAARAGLCS